MRLRRRLLVGCATAWAIGCTLTTSLDDLTGAPPLENPDDGAAPPTDTGVPGDASSFEAAADAADAAPDARWCDRQNPVPTFCRDFDDSQPIGVGWEPDVRGDAAAAERDPLASSFPSSIRSTIGAAEPGCNSARFLRSVGGADFHLQYAIRVGDGAGDGGFTFAYISSASARNATDSCKSYIGVDMQGPGAANLLVQHDTSDGGTVQESHPLSRSPVIGAWSRVDYYSSTDGGVPWVRIDVDGQPALPSTALSGCPTSNTDFSIGLYCGASSEARYDNIALDAP